MKSGVHATNAQDRSYPADAVSANPRSYAEPGHSARPHHPKPDKPALVGEVFCAAPTQVRVKMLEHLMQPLGVLSLAAVANGAFAKIRFRSSWPDWKIRADDAAAVKLPDVVSLAEHALQVDERVLDGLATLLQRTSLATELDAAATLIRLVHQWKRTQRSDDSSQPEPVWH